MALKRTSSAGKPLSRNVASHLEEHVWAALEQYRREHNWTASTSELINEVLAIGLSSAPQDEYLHAKRRALLRYTSNWLRQQLSAFLTDMAAEVDKAINDYTEGKTDGDQTGEASDHVGRQG